MEDGRETTPPTAETPAPFDSAPHDPAALQGCSRPVLIGCGVSILVAALLFLTLIAKGKDLFLWAFETNATQILENLPADATDEDERRLRAAFDGASAAVLEGRIDIDGMRDLQAALALAGKRSVTRDDILGAIEALERVASTPAPSADVRGREPPGVTERAA